MQQPTIAFAARRSSGGNGASRQGAAPPLRHPLSRLLTRAAYASRQLPRVAWYAAHFYTLRRLADQVRQQESHGRARRVRSNASLEQRLNRAMLDLFVQDLANVEAGIYPLPWDHDGSFLTLFERSRLFFRDLPAVEERRRRNATHEVLTPKTR